MESIDMFWLVLGCALYWRYERKKPKVAFGKHVVQLTTRLVMIPCLLTMILALAGIYATLQGWFNNVIHIALSESEAIAQAYFESQRVLLLRTTKEIAEEIGVNLHAGKSLNALEPVLTQLALEKGLYALILCTADGNVVARSALSFALEFEEWNVNLIPSHQDTSFFPNEKQDRLVALKQLPHYSSLYLLSVQQTDPLMLSRVFHAREANALYQNFLKRHRIVFWSIGGFLLLVTLCVIYVTTVRARRLARQWTDPLTELIDMACILKEGALSNFRLVQKPPFPDLRTLQHSIASMVNALQKQKAILHEHNNSLIRNAIFIEQILASTASGIIYTSKDGIIQLANARICAVLEKHSPETLKGKDLKNIFPELVLEGDFKEKNLKKYIVLLSRGKRINLSVTITRSPGIGSVQPEGFLITLEDITAPLAAERNATWLDMAKRVAHEIKNPLTPIRLVAERLQKRHRGDEDIKSCSDIIIRQVTMVDELIGEFTAFARMPPPVFALHNLNAILNEAIFLEKQQFPHVCFAVKGTSDVLWECDRQQILRAFVNILKNACEALVACKTPTILICIEDEKTLYPPKIIIIDNGPGLPPLHFSSTLIEPYVTTKTKGSGLGLAIVKRIMEEHKGTITLSNRSDSKSGCQVTLQFG